MTTHDHHSRLRRWTLAGTTAAALVLAACGSSTSAGSSPSSSSSSDTSSSASSVISPAAATGSSGPGAASSGSYPTQDVLSGITADAALQAELPADVRSNGKLRLGTTITPGVSGLPHAGTATDGSTIGLDVDLRNAVAHVLGVKWDVQNGTFATIIPGVQNGKYDVGQDNFGVTKAREQVVDFATYLTDGQAFLVPSSSSLSKVTQVTDLCGLTIGTSPGSTFQQILTANAPKCPADKGPFKAQYFADTAPIFLGLGNGKLDAYFGPTLSLQYDATHVTGTRFIGQVSSTTVGFVTGKGSPLAKPLSDAVNKLIATGDYAKILAKWGIASSSGITTSAVNPPATL